MSCVRRCLRLSQLCLSYKSTSNAVTRQTHVSCDTKCDDAHALQSLTLLDTPGPLPPLNVSRLKRFEHAGSFPGIITYRIIYPQFGTLTPLRLKRFPQEKDQNTYQNVNIICDYQLTNGNTNPKPFFNVTKPMRSCVQYAAIYNFIMIVHCIGSH